MSAPADVEPLEKAAEPATAVRESETQLSPFPSVTVVEKLERLRARVRLYAAIVLLVLLGYLVYRFTT